ncbi:hypothetical protein K6L09_20555 [Burkholderia cepacia]
MNYQIYETGPSKNMMMNYTYSQLLEAEGFLTDLKGKIVFSASETIYYSFLRSGAKDDELHRAYLQIQNSDIEKLQETLDLLI